MKILHKLLASFFIIIFIISIAGFLVVNESNKAIRNKYGEETVSLAVQVMQDIDRNIYYKIDHLRELSRSKYLRDAISKSNRDFESIENIQVYIDKKDKEWTSTPANEVTPLMRKLFDNNLSKLLKEKIEFYNNEQVYTVYGEVFITNKYGANIAQTGRTTDYRQDDENWWQSAKRDGFYIKDVEYDESADVYSTDVAIRIRDDSGDFLGVMKVVLNIEDTFQNIEKSEVVKRFKKVNFKLLNKEGKNIYSGGRYGIHEFEKDFSKEFFFKKISGDAGFFIPSEKEPGEGEELFTYARSKGFGEYKGLGWILIIEYETDLIFAPLNRLNNKLVFLIIGISLIAVMFSYAISKIISKPIEQLRSTAIKIGDGNLDVSIEINTKDEIGDLATVLSRMTNELRHLATIDRLTGAYNRIKFEEVIKKEIYRANRYNRSLSLLVFDIDHFKRINDMFGHSAGDDVLKTIADIVRKNSRESNYLFRWGGEEFIVLVPEADLEGARIHSERLRKTIEDYNFGEIGTVTVSFGASQYKGGGVADLLKSADVALYKAKSNGRNRVEISYDTQA